MLHFTLKSMKLNACYFQKNFKIKAVHGEIKVAYHHQARKDDIRVDIKGFNKNTTFVPVKTIKYILCGLLCQE